MIENKKYFIDQINSSKANKMTALYHYSGQGFKKARVNLGIFRKSDNLMVGVLQFGCSFQDNIRLDRYVKEPIKKEEYLELNRFSMADSEGKNSESQAISLGLKWIKQNMPEIRLIVSYAGRKEGNYGYIYQATNWEYLGYFLSNGFWFLDGIELHQVTVWFRYNKHCNTNLGYIEGLCDHYKDVRRTVTKQFIYIQRLDKNLTVASPVLPYPKPSTDYPIKTKEVIYKQNDEVFNNPVIERPKNVEYYYVKDKYLFTKRTLQKNGILPKEENSSVMYKNIAMYDAGGHLEALYDKISDIKIEGMCARSIRRAISENHIYKQKWFRLYDEEPEEEIDVPYIAIFDEIPFASLSEIARYLGISRQAVQQAQKRRSKQILNQPIIWID